MRDCYYNSYSLEVKDKFAKIQKFTSLAIVLMGLISFGYFVYWIGALSDEVFMEYGRKFFEPLALLLNPNSGGIEIYLNTCLKMFFGIIPVLFAQYLLNKTEEALLKEHALKEEKKRLKEQKEAHENYMARFDSIQTYSICLSIDYEGKSEVSPQNKVTLNSAIYKKLALALKNIENNAKITQNDVLIFTSSDFSRYDTVYDALLGELSHIKAGIEKNYNLKMIPSLTTDAFSSNQENVDIKKQHFEIQSFNFKNRALTTAMFANKYKHLHHKKYAGIPIGEYAYFTNKKMETYELNVIYKNLNKTLAEI